MAFSPSLTGPVVAWCKAGFGNFSPIFHRCVVQQSHQLQALLRGNFMRWAVLLLVTYSFTSLHAQDWPQWLGPQRTGAINAVIAPWTGPLKVAWQCPVGEGHSAPIVAEGKVFLHTKAEDQDNELLTAWDLAGKQLWQASNPRGPFKSEFGVGPRATPAYSQGKIYSLGVTGLLYCRDAATGKAIWSKNILDDFKAKNLFFGTSSSPLVDDKNVYLMPGGPEASIVAFNKENGQLVWKSGSDKASYSSPTSTTIGDKTYLIFQTERGVVGLQPADGKEVFRIALKDLLNESSTTPVRVGEMLFASSVTFGSMGIKLGTLDGLPAATQGWKNNKLTCYFGTPVEFDGKLYAVTGQIMKPTATLQCIDPLTGNSLWKKPGVGTYHATLYRTKNMLLMLEEKGDLVLLEPNDKEYKEIARAKVCGHTWAHPAYADGLFIVRDGKELKAIQLK